MKTPIRNLRVSAIRSLVRSRGKRVSREFLSALDDYLEKKIHLACDEHNGGRKTLDAALAHYLLVGGLPAKSAKKRSRRPRSRLF
jgi:hypothetical protein